MAIPPSTASEIRSLARAKVNRAGAKVSDTAVFPLHDVVVADRAFVLEHSRCGRGFSEPNARPFRFRSSVGEASIVVGQEAREDPVGSATIDRQAETAVGVFNGKEFGAGIPA